MKQFFKMLFACLLAIVLFFFLGFIFIIGIAAIAGSGSDKTTVENKSILTLNMNENITEQGEENPFGELSNEPTNIPGLQEILLSIKEAKNDSKIEGIYIKMGMSPNGWATLQEIRNALSDFKTSGKFIYAYGEVCDQKSYYVSSVADKVFLNPSGGMEFKGLAINGMFYKGLLDKLDVKPMAFHCGKYKGAHEPFSGTQYSEANKYQLSVLLQDFYSEFLNAVSEKSGTDTATLKTMANTMAVRFPTDALSAKLIDGMIYSDSVENLLKTKLSLKEKDKINFISTSDYASSITDKTSAKDKIAVIYAEGGIMDGEGDDGIYSKNMTRTIRKVAKDEKIKAVVLRVNSPGGSALASEIIYHELLNLKKKKPLVVSMGDYAASGGYYISAAADSIFADANTLTGSIGVVGILFNVSDMLKNKLGVTTDVVKTAEHADFPNFSRPMSDIEKGWIQQYLDSIYITFKNRVATARQMSMEQVEDLAQGHVYSGTLAKQLHLVDEIGSLDRALTSAATLAKLDIYKTAEYPKKKDKMQDLIDALSGKKREETAIRNMLGEYYTIYRLQQMLKLQQNMFLARMPELEIK